jgi:hypothetical protein
MACITFCMLFDMGIYLVKVAWCGAGLWMPVESSIGFG